MNNLNTTVSPGLSLIELEHLCDDPLRDITGQEVHAVLAPGSGGIVVSARDGELIYPVLADNGQPLVFRSVEGALERLADVPYLSPRIELDARAWLH